MQLTQHDTHVHTSFSSDGRSSLRQVAEWACYKLDCDAIWITDHLDFDLNDPEHGSCNPDKILEEIRQVSKDLVKPRLFIGVEVDFQSRFFTQIDEFLSSHRFDFVIGSVHRVNGHFFSGYVQAAYDTYLEECIAAVDSGLFDSLGHLNRPAMNNPHIHFNLLEKLLELLELLVHEKVALEYNTRGINHLDFLHTMRLYKQLGGEKITLGSDAHHASKLMLDFDKAKKVLTKAKITNLTVYIDRTPRFVPLH